MAVSLNGTGTAGVSTGSYVTTLSLTTFTVSAGSDRVLYAVVNFDQPVSAVTATWNSVSMTQVNSQTYRVGDCSQIVFRLIAPATGNNTLAVSWTGSSPCSITAASFAGVDQTTPEGTFVVPSPAQSTTPSSGAVTSGANDATVSFASSGDPSAGTTAFTTPETQTSIHRDTATAETANSVTYALGGSSNTHDYTLTASKYWAVAAVRVLAASGGGSSDVPVAWLTA